MTGKRVSHFLATLLISLSKMMTRFTGFSGNAGQWSEWSHDYSCIRAQNNLAIQLEHLIPVTDSVAW